MKHQILSEILKQIKFHPNLRRKVRVLALIGLIGLPIILGLAVWLSVKTVSYIATKSSELSVNQFSNVQTYLESIPNVNVQACWEKGQSLLTINPWVEHTAIENILKLKVACVDQKPTACEGSECLQNIQTLKQFERSAI